MGLRFGFGWVITAAMATVIGCGGEQAPDTVDHDLYNEVMASTDSDGLAEQCVSGGAYWSIHNKYASDPAKLIKWPRDNWTIKDTEDRLVCGQTLHAILTSAWDGSAWHALAKEWIPAYLNMKAGAQFGPGVAHAFHQSFTLVMSCNVTTLEPAKTYKETLQAWSSGNNGSSSCGW